MPSRSKGQSDDHSPLRRRRARAALKVCGALALALLGLFGLGLLLFIGSIEKMPQNRNIRADAIVVLTGGDSRIAEAVKLLDAGHGGRLLISGVHPKTTADMLRQVNPHVARLFDCCIDLDRRARDTIGNAEGTRRWLAKRGFRSVIVVTSSYHMPRGLVELRRALPELELIPYPVMPTRVRLDRWWAHPGTFRLLSSEFVKYLASLARCSLARLVGAEHIYKGIRTCFDPIAV